jgi:DNA-binding CsgD family transcriptional regulator
VAAPDRVAALERGREAAARGDWPEAYAALKSIGDDALEPRDLDTLADAAWWVSEPLESLAFRQHAYAGYASASDEERAAATASRLAIEFFQREQPSVGSGWLARAQRHAREVPESAGHGYLALIEATVLRFGGDLDHALELALRAIDIGKRFGDPDLLAMAIHIEGIVDIAAGRVAEGLALLDEAMTSVLADELTPYFTGIVYCNVVATCLDLGDLGRAGEWAEAARLWCQTLPPESPFSGQCRVNRAVVARLSGWWDEAEAEASRAIDELSRHDPWDAGHAFYQLGEIHRVRGEFAAAEQAFDRARELGADPLPGSALVRLAQRKLDAAVASLRLADGSGPPPQRARLLIAVVEVSIAAGDLDRARAGAGELEAIAGSYRVPFFEAAAATARGTVLLAEGDVETAIESLRHACVLWQDLKLPYEAARARVQYGLALRGSGDDEGGSLELRSALSSFEKLGAAPDADATKTLLEGGSALPNGLTAREVEVLRLVASGKTNRDMAVELVISEHTVGRHLQNIYAKLGVSTRAAATAFAFEHDLA